MGTIIWGVLSVFLILFGLMLINEGGCFGLIFSLLLISIGGYGVYRNFIYDYSDAIDNALSINDFAKAEELLFEMSQRESDTDTGTLFSYHESKYSIASQKVLRAKITYLLNQGDQTSSEKIISVLLNISTEENPILGVYSSGSAERQNERYNNEVGKFNAFCQEIFSASIAKQNFYLAERMVKIFKPIVAKDVSRTHLFSSDEYNYYFSYEVQTNAASTLQIAIEGSSFK